MPELPEVETIKVGLEKNIKGKTIQKVEVRLPKIISLGPQTVSNIRKSNLKLVKKFQKALKGQKVKSVQRRAKMLIIDLEGPFALLIHLKMSGQLIFVKKAEQPKLVKVFNTSASPKLTLPHKYTHVIFEFQDGSKLYYNDLRQFGYIRLVRDDEIEQVKELANFGPEPMTRQFSLNYFQEKVKGRPKISMKQFLMDPKIVAGIGNIYSDEILFCAKVRPTRQVASLKTKEIEKIFNCIRPILKAALKRQGSSVGDFFKTDGTEGTYGRVHKVYGRAKQKCRICGTIIKSVKLGGRTSSYCPKCQK